jgi:hypothetical protein
MLPKFRCVVLVAVFTPGALLASDRAGPARALDARVAWEKAGELVGKKVHLTGNGTVKRDRKGVHVVFAKRSGGPIATGNIKNEDDLELLGLPKLAVGGSVERWVKVSTTVLWAARGQMLLDDGLLLELEAPKAAGKKEEVAEAGGKKEETADVEVVAESKPKEVPWLRAVPGSLPAPAAASETGSLGAESTSVAPARARKSGGSAQVPALYLRIARSDQAPATGKPVQVRGYYRKDGTYVRPHTRAIPGTGTRRR